MCDKVLELGTPCRAPTTAEFACIIMFDHLSEAILDAIELAALGIELLAVAIIVLAVIWGLLTYVRHSLHQPALLQERFTQYKMVLGRALLLGLEILVAADIILTVALDLSFETLGMLGLLVLIRTFLHFVLELEVTDRWPWQGSHKSADAPRK